MKWGLYVVATVLLLMTLAGCWDDQPVNTRALVLLLGISQTRQGTIAASLQIPTAPALQALVSGNGAETSIYVLTGTGPTLASAIQGAQAQSDRLLYLGQLQLVLLSTNLSKTNLAEVLSSLTRMGMLDKTTDMAATSSSVSKFLAVTSPQAAITPLYFTTLFSCASCQPVYLERTLWDTELGQALPGKNFWLPLLQLSPAGFSLNQVAVYHDGRLAAVLTPTETQTLGYILGQTARDTLSIRFPNGTRASLRAVSATDAAQADWRRGRLEVTLRLALVAALDALPTSSARHAYLAPIRHAVSRYVAQAIIRLVSRLQALGANPTLLGENVLWSHPFLQARWSDVWQAARITVHVHTEIHNLGDTT